MPFARSRGVDICYEVTGEGKPVFLVHGFSATADDNWKRTGWYAALTRAGRRVIACDLLGHGQSGKSYDAQDYAPQLMALDILAVMDEVGITQADVIGYSMGAQIGCALLCGHYARLTSLVLGGLGENMLQEGEAGAALAEGLLAEDADSLSRPLIRSFRLYAEQLEQDRRALAACALRPRQSLGAENFRHVTIPVLVVVGARDDIAGAPEPLARLIPGAKAITIPGADHVYTIPHAMFKGSVIDFLSGWLD
jgi:pimeloyl-ACP methyl ester carboxylesterase